MSICQRFARPSIQNIKSINLVSKLGSVCQRKKHTLPMLQYGYAELEPAISGQIMELHHSKHHQTYVNGLNEAQEKYKEALHTNDVVQQINLQALIKFHGGGHINHTLFWENLAPVKNGGGAPPTSTLAEVIDKTWGSFEDFKKQFNMKLAGIQGSGWSWLAEDSETKKLEIITTPNQDPIGGKYRPIMGIDAWEHAYYLQYQNRKAEYFGAIWEVINWKTAENRFRT